MSRPVAGGQGHGMHPRHVRSLSAVLLCTAASVGTAIAALDLASGVTRTRGGCCETEFIDGTTLHLLWLLYPVIAAAGYWSWRTALLGVAGVALPQWLAMNEVMDRYAESGWGDGLEVLGYLLPIQVAVLASGAVLVGALVGRRRRAQDQ